MIEIQRKGNEYIVVNVETRRIIGRSKSQLVALEQMRQRVMYQEKREATLRRNRELRAEAIGA